MARDLAATVVIARRAKEFLKGEFWLENLFPLVAKEQEAFLLQQGWRPGQAVDEQALKSSYFSGAHDGMGRVFGLVKKMVEDGREAEEKLKALEDAE